MSKSLGWCASKLINCLIIAGGTFFPWQLHIANQLRQTHDSLSLSHMHTFFLLFLHCIQTRNRENWKPFVETRRMEPISRKHWFESSLINFQPLVTFLWNICPLSVYLLWAEKESVGKGSLTWPAAIITCSVCFLSSGCTQHTQECGYPIILLSSLSL